MTISNVGTASSEFEEILFPNVMIRLPKGDIRRSWEKVKKYMEIYLEDN